MKNINETKYNYMLEQNKDYMDLTALSFGDRRITYEEMHDRIEKYVRLLYSKGVRQGDVIGICAYNTPESVYLLYALDIIGAIVVGYSPFDNKEKTKLDIEMTKPKMVISVDMCYKNFKDWEKALNFSTILYSPVDSLDDMKIKVGYKLLQLKNGNFKLSKDSNLKSLLKKNYSDVDYVKAPFEQDGLRDILFTGGSTGVHKGVELSDNGLNSVVEGMNSIFTAEPGMIHLGNIPFGHMAYGRSILHYALCNNMEYALTIKAMPSDFYDEIVRTHATAAVGGPPHWVSLIEQQGDKFVPSSRLKAGSLSELHYATSGGEAKKETTENAINEALKYCGSDAKLGDGLGATETWASMMINNGKIHHRGTVGEPISTLDVKLVDLDTGKEVKDGEKGLLYVSGPSVMLGYHNNPEETSKVISYDENGKRWINIGDFLMKTPDGEYKYVGRQKRNFVSGCDNIYPEELESLLLLIPEIREVVVTPISDEMVQYIPRYHISLYDTNIDYKELEEKINALVMSKLNENWLPGSIAYYDKPLERMQNSKVNISYYKELDQKALENNEIDNTSAKQLRLKRI
ncbi:MAG: class I adenylate-forming enzyme family protein [Candidatus Faecenecus gallistercoris]|nr:class I adenylate-forming enzyme family protein [Candidatus Faecenecus gallistercoris]